MNIKSSIPDSINHYFSVQTWSGPKLGVTLMLLSTGVFASMHGLVRYVSAEIHPFEIALFRNLFGLLAILPLLLSTGRNGLLSKQPKLQLVRGLVGVVAMLSWFYAVSVVPIAEATALSFSAVIFASIGSVFFLAERMGIRRWSAVIIGFIGTLIILRPGIGAISGGALLVLMSAVAWGVNLVILKRLSSTDSTISIVLWMTVMMTILSLPPALWVWTTPTLSQLGWLALIGLLAATGTLMMTHAMRMADATALMPLDFTRLIWAGIIGFVVFAEIPDIWTWAGGLLIFASATYITFREALLKGKVTVTVTDKEHKPDPKSALAAPAIMPKTV